MKSNAVILLKFWRPQSTLPCFGLQYSISKKTRTTVSLSSLRGVFSESSLRKQAWRNPKEGRVGCLHQDIFTRKVTDIAFTSDFCNNHSRPASPASLCLTSPRPCPTRPRVPCLMSMLDAFVTGQYCSVLLSRENPSPVGPRLCTDAHFPQKKLSLSPFCFRRSGRSVHRLVGPKKKEKGGCIN